MVEHDDDVLPQAIRDGLGRARDRERRASGGRLRVQVGDVWHPVLSCDAEGFDVSAEVAAKLRGHVEIHEGPRLIRSALVVTTEPVGEVVRCIFKRSTAPRTEPALDYERVGTAPAGYIGRSAGA